MVLTPSQDRREQAQRRFAETKALALFVCVCVRASERVEAAPAAPTEQISSHGKVTVSSPVYSPACCQKETA